MNLPDNPKMVQAQKEGKAPMHLIPVEGLKAVARVMATGAGKYGIRNWRIDPIRASTYIGALWRHGIIEWAEGSDVDKDSGEHPLAHVVACCLIVMDAEKRGMLIDDRLEAESKVPPAVLAEQEKAVPVEPPPGKYARILVDNPHCTPFEAGDIVAVTEETQTHVALESGYLLNRHEVGITHEYVETENG